MVGIDPPHIVSASWHVLNFLLHCGLAHMSAHPHSLPHTFCFIGLRAFFITPRGWPAHQAKPTRCGPRCYTRAFFCPTRVGITIPCLVTGRGLVARSLSACFWVVPRHRHCQAETINPKIPLNMYRDNMSANNKCNCECTKRERIDGRTMNYLLMSLLVTR